MAIRRPDRVFLGGSSGNMEEILDLVTELNPAVQLVINVIALESLSQAMNGFGKKDGSRRLSVCRCPARQSEARTT